MRKIEKKKNLFLMCTRTKNRQKLSNTGYIKGEASRLLRTKSSKTTFEENVTLFKQRLRNRGYLDNLIDKTLRSQFQPKNIGTTKQRKKAQKHFAVCYGISPSCA